MSLFKALLSGKNSPSKPDTDTEDVHGASLIDDGLTPNRRVLVKNFSTAFNHFVETSTGTSHSPFTYKVNAFPFELVMTFEWPVQKAPAIKIELLSEFIRAEERKFGIQNVEIVVGGFKFYLNPDKQGMDMESAASSATTNNKSKFSPVKKRDREEDSYQAVNAKDSDPRDSFGEGARVVKRYKTRPSTIPTPSATTQRFLDILPEDVMAPLPVGREYATTVDGIRFV